MKGKLKCIILGHDFRVWQESFGNEGGASRKFTVMSSSDWCNQCGLTKKEIFNENKNHE